MPLQLLKLNFRLLQFQNLDPTREFDLESIVGHFHNNVELRAIAIPLNTEFRCVNNLLSQLEM